MPPGTQSDRQAKVRALEVAERSASTRTALVDAARRLFTEKGYFATSTEELVAAAGVGTRGALYHHFADKKDLFLAVFTEIQEERRGEANEIANGDPLARLRAGIMNMLDAVARPDVQRILMIDGPAVLGPEYRTALYERHGLSTTRGLLRRAVDDGLVTPFPLEMMSRLLLAAAFEAAHAIATSSEPGPARREAAQAIDRLLDGLTVSR